MAELITSVGIDCRGAGLGGMKLNHINTVTVTKAYLTTESGDFELDYADVGCSHISGTGKCSISDASYCPHASPVAFPK